MIVCYSIAVCHDPFVKVEFDGGWRRLNQNHSDMTHVPWKLGYSKGNFHSLMARNQLNGVVLCAQKSVYTKDLSL